MIETKFKDTEIGKIPMDWTLFNVLKDTTINARIGWQGLTTKEYLSFGEYYLITGKDFLNGSIDWDNCSFVSESRYNQDRKIQIKEEDVLVSKDGTIGKIAYLNNIPGKGTLNSGVFVIRSNKSSLLQRYLAIGFMSKYFDNFMSNIVAGSTIKHLYQKDIIKFTFAGPASLSEQKAIADALSSVDGLIAALEKKIEKKRLIKQGTMQQLLTGKQRLKGFNQSWTEKKLSDVALICRGGSPRPIESYLTNEANAINWIKIGDVSKNSKYIEKTKEKIKPSGLTSTRKVKKGDLILSNSMSFGRPYILNIEGCIHDGWLVIQEYGNTYDTDFLYYILSSNDVFNQYIAMAAGSSVKNLNKEKVGDVLIKTPSDLSEQHAIAQILSDMDAEISALEQKREKMRSVKQGMMQQLLTGKIRLVETSAKKQEKSANVFFKRSVLAAEIADRLCDEPTFGHVKMEKILFLSERLCRIDIASNYHRDAAGPYDNRALRSIDSQLKKQKWFEVVQTEKGKKYRPMSKRGGHRTYFDRYYSEVAPIFDWIINTFRTQRTEKCEIVATLYSAWEDLLRSGTSFADKDIVNEVLNNWHESKKRISKERWENALSWMRENGLEPKIY